MIVGCSTAPATQAGKDDLVRRAEAALTAWNREIPGVEALVRGSRGYVLFPEILKGGVGLGAAYGRGVVYAHGRHVGYADLSQGSLGVQLGGQAYQELIVFDDDAALERFEQGRLDLTVDTSAVLITGYATRVQFAREATVFMKPVGGVMGELTLVGQKLTFAPR